MFAEQEHHEFAGLQCRNNDIELPDTPYPQLTIIGLLGICLSDRSEIVSRKLDKSQQLTKRSPVNVTHFSWSPQPRTLLSTCCVCLSLGMFGFMCL